MVVYKAALMTVLTPIQVPYSGCVPIQANKKHKPQANWITPIVWQCQDGATSGTHKLAPPLHTVPCPGQYLAHGLVLLPVLLLAVAAAVPCCMAPSTGPCTAFDQLRLRGLCHVAAGRVVAGTTKGYTCQHQPPHLHMTKRDVATAQPAVVFCHDSSPQLAPARLLSRKRTCFGKRQLDSIINRHHSLGQRGQEVVVSLCPQHFCQTPCRQARPQ